MRTLYASILIYTLLATRVGNAQVNIKELVYSHLSSEDLLVGETLFFNNYVISQQTSRLSNLSKLLYVELLNEKGKPVYQTKIRLDSGVGSGKYFIPSNLPTGNYQYVAYTRWMKNFDDYFRQTIKIINPYLVQELKAPTVEVLQVSAAVEGDGLLEGVKNKVVIQVTNQFGEGQRVAGKLISLTTDFAISLETNVFGFYSCELTPTDGESYQLIINRSGNLEFFNILDTNKKDIQFRVQTVGKTWIASVKSAGANIYSNGQLQIYDNAQLLYDKPMPANTSLSVSKNDMPEKLLRFIYTTENGEVLERLILNKSTIKIEGSKVQSYSPLQQIIQSVPIPDSSFLSISIEKIGTRVQMSAIDNFLEIDNKIDLRMSDQFYALNATKQIDEMLIVARYNRNHLQTNRVHWLPEYRYGLLQGRILDANNKGQANVPVGLFFSGTNPNVTARTTDDDGRFILNYRLNDLHGTPRLSILDGQDELNIEIAPEFYPDYPPFVSKPLTFDSLRIRQIVQRSIYNQIENAYAVEELPAQPKEIVDQFEGVKSYFLDQYKRFNTMRDTFIELIAEVGVSKNEQNFNFRMRSKDRPSTNGIEQPTLILLDGAYVESIKILQMSPYLVERIDVIDHRYYFGSIVFDGIIAIHSLDGRAGEIEQLGMEVPLVEIQDPVLSQRLNLDKSSERIPNYQDLLYWQTGFYNKKLELSFQTSSLKGLFEIRIEGISIKGNPVSRRMYFKVQD